MTTSEIDRYVIKQEILDLLHTRARGADRYDPDLMRACHPPDATDNHGVYQGSMYGLIDMLEEARLKGPPCLGKLHVISNALFAFKGDDVFVESYHVAHETYEEPRGVISAVAIWTRSDASTDVGLSSIVTLSTIGHASLPRPNRFGIPKRSRLTYSAAATQKIRFIAWAA
jgi:hypothetical protein